MSSGYKVHVGHYTLLRCVPHKVYPLVPEFGRVISTIVAFGINKFRWFLSLYTHHAIYPNLFSCMTCL